MGRRKERRLASMSAAGRRVKLDLFAEPSGDLGGSSTLEEVGGDGDSKTHAELPSSPFSSGQQPQNPLLLLEQYSDEEFDEDSNEVHNHAVADDASIAMDEELKVAEREVGDGEINHGKESIQRMDPLLMDNSTASQDPSQKIEKESITDIGPDDLLKQTNNMEEAIYPAAPEPDEHLVGDLGSGWKMVLHEESNQYYYWNIVTGETSWEVPDVLAQETVRASAEKVIRDTEGKVDALVGAYKSSMPLDMEEGITSTELNSHPKIDSQASNTADQGTKMDGSNEGFKSDFIEVKTTGNTDANQMKETSLLGGHSVESKSGADFSSQLLKRCESLLERLDSVKGLNCHVEVQGLKLRCRLEIETRVTDIKALASHGSSLLPFWLHLEAQLKQLEAAVDGITQRDNSATPIGFEAAPESCEEGIGADTEIDSSKSNKALFVAAESHAGDTLEKSSFEGRNNGANTVEHVPSMCNSGAYPVNNVGGKSEITGTEKGSELSPRPALHSVEDVDMDVDMEVEDTSSIKPPHGNANCHASTELSNVQNTLQDQEPTVPGQLFNVPPPDKEWIPPPPPDNDPFPPPPPDDEPFPPPPPDEPPETSYPPALFGSLQAFPYPEQYALTYPGSALEYYVQTNPEVSGTNLYTHSEGGQVTVPHVPHYYEAVPNLYAVAPVTVNPVESTAYYGLQNGTLNPVPLPNSTAESSGTQSEPVPEETVVTGSLDYHPEAGSSLLVKNNINVDNLCHGPVNAPAEVPEDQPFVGAPATSSMTNAASVSSTSDTTSVSSAAPGVAATKSQSKVSRTKKRTVAVVSTLRTNKKVSSLVDKWKAAKEELHEEEEEPEDAYEILEKKRQRQIEQWRAHQIASGEAKDNANFQPLGGDWRERVKRKRAQRMKETGQTSPDVAKDTNQQADIIELSKGLPSGWQAYWDDSSKQVYYGNMLTSETTWIRPAD